MYLIRGNEHRRTRLEKYVSLFPHWFYIKIELAGDNMVVPSGQWSCTECQRPNVGDSTTAIWGHELNTLGHQACSTLWHHVTVYMHITCTAVLRYIPPIQELQSCFTAFSVRCPSLNNLRCVIDVRVLWITTKCVLSRFLYIIRIKIRISYLKSVCYI